MTIKIFSFDRRYRRFVPKDVRRLGEGRDVPKPNRYVPSAQGIPIDIVGRRSGSVERGKVEA